MGYNNYSVQEQMQLCTVVDQILPLERNMWERVAMQYNTNRTRTAPERDFESLRRKFRSLYGKPKLTGRNGEISPRFRAIAFAKEIQRKIEEEEGVHTSHDGLDNGQEDVELLATVEQVTSGTAAGTRRVAAAGLEQQRASSGEESGDEVAHEPSDQEDLAEEEGRRPTGDNDTGGDRVSTEVGGGGDEGPPESEADDAISQYAQNSAPPSPPPTCSGRS